MKITVNFFLTVSYLTSLDKYSIGSIILISLMLIYHAMFAAFIGFLSDSLAYRLDKFAFSIFFILIIGKQLLYANWLYKVNLYRENLIKNNLFHTFDKNSLDNFAIDKKLN